jgi:hypothetical protein
LHRHQILSKPESQDFLVVDLPTGVIINNFKAEPRGAEKTTIEASWSSFAVDATMTPSIDGR